MNKNIMILLFSLLPSLLFASVDEKLEYYLQDENLEKAVAKLFVVGYPGDIYNYTKCNECSFLLKELQIGGIMLNQYNLPASELTEFDRQTAFRKIRSLIQDIGYQSVSNLRSSLKTQPLLMVDFESYRFSSVKYPLSPPPSSLALASTGDANFTYAAGLLSGYQLKQMGIDVILGPVLDLNLNLQQGKPNTTIRTRAYSDNFDIVYSHANAFIDGIKKSNLIVFTKHFPPYSSIDSNPHSQASSHVGSSNFIKSELEVFKALSEKVDGIMTSHLNIGSDSSYLPFTFSKHQMSDYLLENKGISNHNLYITDDMSHMEAVKVYQEKNNKSYADIAYEAFQSGHNLLLFSHYGSESDFNRKELANSINYIAKRVRENKESKAHLKRSLKRIFTIQEARIKQRIDVSEFDHRAEQILLDTKFNDIDEYFTSTYKNGAISLKDEKLPNLTELSNDHRFLLIADKSVLSQYDEFKNRGERYTTIPKPNYHSIEEFGSFLRDELRKNDFVYFTVDNIDDANAVDHINIYFPKLLEKLVILLHENPSYLKDSVINKAKFILGNFSRDPISYRVDLHFILYGNKPKVIDYLPVSLNNKSYHDTSGLVPINYASNKSVIEFFATEKERKLNQENKNLKSELKSIRMRERGPIEMVRLILTVFFIVSGLFVLLHVSFALIPENKRSNHYFNQVIHGINIVFFRGGKIYNYIIVAFLVSCVLLFLSFLFVDFPSFNDGVEGLKPFVQ